MWLLFYLIPNRYPSVKSMIENSSSPNVFVKEMAFTLNKEQFHLLPAGYKHTFLIRHPFRVFQSDRIAMIAYLSSVGLLKVHEHDYDFEKDNPQMPAGLFFKEVYDLWTFVRTNIDPYPIVIDGDDLFTNPAEVLPKYCRAVGIPYNQSLLRWDSSTEVTKSWRTAFGSVNDVATRYRSYYQRALESSEFRPPRPMPSIKDLTPDVIRCSYQVMKYYNEMYESRLKP